MRRIMLLVTVGLVMAAMMLVMAMPAFAFHDHVLNTGECGQGNCTGFGFDDNPGRSQNNDQGVGRSGERDDGDTGDDRNDVCFEHGVCIGTNNN